MTWKRPLDYSRETCRTLTLKLSRKREMKKPKCVWMTRQEYDHAVCTSCTFRVPSFSLQRAIARASRSSRAKSARRCSCAEQISLRSRVLREIDSRAALREIDTRAARISRLSILRIRASRRLEWPFESRVRASLAIAIELERRIPGRCRARVRVAETREMRTSRRISREMRTSRRISRVKSVPYAGIRFPRR